MLAPSPLTAGGPAATGRDRHLRADVDDGSSKGVASTSTSLCHAEGEVEAPAHTAATSGLDAASDLNQAWWSSPLITRSRGDRGPAYEGRDANHDDDSEEDEVGINIRGDASLATAGFDGEARPASILGRRSHLGSRHSLLDLLWRTFSSVIPLTTEATGVRRRRSSLLSESDRVSGEVSLCSLASGLTTLSIHETGVIAGRIPGPHHQTQVPKGGIREK